ncbi:MULTISPECIES: hypothetical protein [unclassified Microbacterium]|uniref:hypothetical protein n=1 Tax=unclassified Microbacterium TaxID=2609290 RepID=UPI00109D6AB9|nr:MULTISPECIES: hypothetical protein [unclassified Microbacterium]
MSTQIALRLSDEMVAELDALVSAGAAPSRTALVSVAIARELRRRAAEHDAEILNTQGAGDDLDSLVDWTVGHIVIER